VSGRLVGVLPPEEGSSSTGYYGSTVRAQTAASASSAYVEYPVGRRGFDQNVPGVAVPNRDTLGVRNEGQLPEKPVGRVDPSRGQVADDSRSIQQSGTDRDVAVEAAVPAAEMKEDRMVGREELLVPVVVVQLCGGVGVNDVHTAGADETDATRSRSPLVLRAAVERLDRLPDRSVLEATGIERVLDALGLTVRTGDGREMVVVLESGGRPAVRAGSGCLPRGHSRRRVEDPTLDGVDDAMARVLEDVSPLDLRDELSGELFEMVRELAGVTLADSVLKLRERQGVPGSLPEGKQDLQA